MSADPWGMHIRLTVDVRGQVWEEDIEALAQAAQAIFEERGIHVGCFVRVLPEDPGPYLGI